MPFSDFRSTTRSGGRAPVGRVIGNPTAMVAWAIETGRIDAVDEALWLARLAGPGSMAYSDELLERQGRRYEVRTTKCAT